MILFGVGVSIWMTTREKRIATTVPENHPFYDVQMHNVLNVKIINQGKHRGENYEWQS
jgi:hypothetical protein